MPRKALGDKPMSAAERQARVRAARRLTDQQTQQAVAALRTALSHISDRTSARLRTKAALETTLDDIGIIAAEALANAWRPADDR